MGFKSNIGDVTIQYPRVCGPFFWGVLTSASSGKGVGRGRGDTLERVSKAPGTLMGDFKT